MKKFLLALFFAGLLFPATSLAAGYTTVTATVKDPNGLAYANCAFNVSFLNQSTAPVQPLLNGSPFQQVYSGQSCDNTGAFTIVLPDNNVITPTPSKWTFSVCASDGKTCFSTSITITGTTQSITSTLQAAAVVLPFSLQTIGGTGGSGQVAFWTGANSLSGDSGLFWDNVNKILGVGKTPTVKLDVVSLDNIDTTNIMKVSSANLAEGIGVGFQDIRQLGITAAINLNANTSGKINIGNVSGGGVFLAAGGGNVGIGTTSASNILSIDGQAARTFWMERQLNAATPGNALTVQASGTVVGGTNLAGGALNLSGGTSTGTGTSVINFNTSSAGVSGTADNAPTTKIRIDGAGHLISTGSTAPTITAGCGTSPSISGTDFEGTITIGTGGVATSCTVTFGVAWTSIPKCFSNHEGAILATRAVATTTTVVIDALTALTAGGKLDYLCSSN